MVEAPVRQYRLLARQIARLDRLQPRRNSPARAVLLRIGGRFVEHQSQVARPGRIGEIKACHAFGITLEFPAGLRLPGTHRAFGGGVDPHTLHRDALPIEVVDPAQLVDTCRPLVEEAKYHLDGAATNRLTPTDLALGLTTLVAQGVTLPHQAMQEAQVRQGIEPVAAMGGVQQVMAALGQRLSGAAQHAKHTAPGDGAPRGLAAPGGAWRQLDIACLPGRLEGKQLLTVPGIELHFHQRGETVRGVTHRNLHMAPPNGYVMAGALIEQQGVDLTALTRQANRG